jgi:MOSC domain-containing protein YiiM
MVPLTEVWAIPGKGLEGDRYFHGAGTFSASTRLPDVELTLIESEAIETLARSIALTPADSRRNLVTRGISLNELVGRQFEIGDVRMLGHRLCEPCSRLRPSAADAREVIDTLRHRGGLRAQILQQGRLRIGDPIRPV